jgi:hypothetical protein
VEWVNCDCTVGVAAVGCVSVEEPRGVVFRLNMGILEGSGTEEVEEEVVEGFASLVEFVEEEVEDLVVPFELLEGREEDTCAESGASSGSWAKSRRFGVNFFFVLEPVVVLLLVLVVAVVVVVEEAVSLLTEVVGIEVPLLELFADEGSAEEDCVRLMGLAEAFFLVGALAGRCVGGEELLAGFACVGSLGTLVDTFFLVFCNLVRLLFVDFVVLLDDEGDSEGVFDEEVFLGFEGFSQGGGALEGLALAFSPMRAFMGLEADPVGAGDAFLGRRTILVFGLRVVMVEIVATAVGWLVYKMSDLGKGLDRSFPDNIVLRTGRL